MGIYWEYFERIIIGIISPSYSQFFENIYIPITIFQRYLPINQSSPALQPSPRLPVSRLVLEPGIVRVMHEAGVNVDVLAEMLDLVWEDPARGSEDR